MKKLLPIIMGASCLAAGSVVAAESPSSRTTTEQYRDWVKVCVEQEGTAQCEIKQNLLNQNRQLVSVISVAKPQTEYVMQFALPHMLDLSVPVVIAVDNETPLNLSFKFCNPVACYVMAEADSPLFELFRAGNSGTLSATAINGEEFKLGFSLSGFGAALGAL